MLERSKSKLLDNITGPIYLLLGIVIIISLYLCFKRYVYLNVLILIAIPFHTTISKKKLKTLMSIADINFFSTFLNLVCWVAAFALLISGNVQAVNRQIEKLREYDYTLFDIVNFIFIAAWLILCFFPPYKTFGDTQEIEKAVEKRINKKAPEKI